MAYQSKYTGLQIDDILDSVEYKQSKIEDLASIRAGAQKGATALQSYTEKYTGTVTGIKLNGVVKSGSGVIDLGTISTTETDPVFSASPAASITEAKKAEWDNKMDKVTLATVATSGNYNDLTNKPTIPSAVTESTVSGWGFTKNVGTYSKPSSGIPKSDLASAVQTSLGKADTALQSYTEQYKGTITGVSANGTSVATSGVANIPAASTSAYGVTKLSSATNSTSTTLAATANAVKTAYDLANGKQDKLVSGTNIKTINGTSILGSGDITISGGSSNANVQAVDTGDVIDDVTVNYATTAYVDSKVANIDLTNYATTAYVDGLVGDINSVLESIINGGGNVSIFPITLSYNVDGNETYAKVYAELDKISNKNLSSVPIDAGLIYIDLTTFAIGIDEISYEVSDILFEGNNTYSLGCIENGPEMHTIMLSSDGKVWCQTQ